MRGPIRWLLGAGLIKRVDDTGAAQLLQVDAGPRAPDGAHELIEGAPRAAEYGLASCPPTDSAAVLLFLDEERSRGIVIGTHYGPGRPTGLSSGEMAIFNSVAGTVLKLSADGKAHLNCDLIVTGKVMASDEITARTAGTAAALGAVRDAYHDHKHAGVQTGAGTSGPSDHLSV